MKLFKLIVAIVGMAALIVCVGRKSHGDYYRGMGASGPHGHSGDNDGGVLTDPAILGGDIEPWSVRSMDVYVGTRTLTLLTDIVGSKTSNQGCSTNGNQTLNVPLAYGTRNAFRFPVDYNQITFSTTTDRLGEWNGSTFTATNAETVSLNATIQFRGVNAQQYDSPTKEFGVHLFKNGVFVSSVTALFPNLSSDIGQVAKNVSFAQSVDVEIGDKLSLYATVLVFSNGFNPYTGQWHTTYQTEVWNVSQIATSLSITAPGVGHTDSGGIHFPDGTVWVSSSSVVMPAISTGGVTVNGDLVVDGTTTLNGPLSAPLSVTNGGTGQDSLSKISVASATYADVAGSCPSCTGGGRTVFVSTGAPSETGASTATITGTTISGGSLSTGDVVRIKASLFADIGANCKLYFGGTVLREYDALFEAAGGYTIANVSIDAASAQTASGYSMGDPATSTAAALVSASPTEDTSGSITVRVVGNGDGMGTGCIVRQFEVDHP